MISVITPSVRPELIPMVARCLKRQTYKDFEWLIGTPPSFFNDFNEALAPFNQPYKLVPEPPKRKDDYYGLNKCWNSLFRKTQGELIVNIVDGIWFPPDTLERLHEHYMSNKKACISCVGNQYDKIENGKPEGMVWRDPRMRSDQGSFYEVRETEMELCLASFPRQMIYDIGGFEERFDKGAACSEKEAMLRAYKAGYKLYLDQTIEYRAIMHPRLTREWDTKYLIACDLMREYVPKIESGERKALDYVK